MNRKWFVNIALLLLALVASPVQGQIDTCIGFEEVMLNTMPTGWTVVDNEGFPVTDPLDASLSTSWGRRYLNIATKDLYVSLPDMNIDYSAGAYLHFWARTTSVIAYMEVGTMIDPTNPLTFHLLAVVGGRTSWQRYSVDLSAAPSGDRYLAIRVYTTNTSSPSRALIDHLHLTTNSCGASNFHVENMTADSVTFAWNSVGTPWVTLTMSDDQGNIYSSDRVVSGVTLPYDAERTYTIRLQAVCDSLNDDCSTNYDSGEQLLPVYDLSTCVDGTILMSSKATPYYGTFDNPYAAVGAVDNTPINPSSRHTVNDDTTMRDPIVGNDLRVIPEGETWSVRLGNWLSGGQAEAMLYRIPVDTTQFDMLILKYAAVMENPSHNAEEQPRFRIEMLDEEMNLIAPVSCNSYDFISSTELGWNTLAGDVLWKDWTIVGIDLSGYHNRNVLLRLTTYDCSLGAHYGYAYYHLSCAQKTLEFMSCSDGDSNTLAAPQGFSYRWHRDDSDLIASTSRITTLPMDNHTWYCDLGFIGDPSCSVTMSVVSRLVMPVAAFNYEVSRDSCRFKVQLHNRSYLTTDTSSRCSWCKWIFENGDTSMLSDPVIYLSDTLAHNITLVSGLEGGDCYDTLVTSLAFSLVRDTTMVDICHGESYGFCDTVFDSTGVYTLQPNCDSIKTLVLTVHDTTLIVNNAYSCGQYTYHDSLLTASGDYNFVYSSSVGCDSSYLLHLTVFATYDTVDSVFICPGFPYVYRDVDYGGPTDFVAHLHTRYDCDSTVHVSLVAADPEFAVSAYYSFDNRLWMDSLPIKGCVPTDLFLRDSTPGAINWRWTLTIGDTASSFAAAPATQFSFADSTTRATLELKVESAHGCRDSLLWPIYIFPSPVADFGWSPETPVDVAPEALFFSLSQPEDCDHYRWFFPREAGSSAYDTAEGKQTYYIWPGDLPVGDFDVSMVAYQDFHYDTVVHTCSDTAQHTVTILTALLQFPNLVTPDGDGFNDVWEVVNLVDLGLYTMNELWIYDSWGALIYHVKNINSHDQAWNPLNTRSPDGTYYFRFSAKSGFGLIRRNGLIEVIRQQ